MDKLCKNCKFYSKPEEDWIKEDRGNCSCDKFVYNVDMKITDYPLNDRLEYWDYESYSAGFYVGSNFGCIHFLKHKLIK